MRLSNWVMAAALGLGFAAGAHDGIAAQQPSTAKYDGPTCFATVLPAINSSAGTVLESRDKPQLVYTLHDRLYARSEAGPLQVGEEYLLYREETELRHPSTGDALGTVVNLLGRARVLAAEDDRALLVVTAACAEIEAGDSLHAALPQTQVTRGRLQQYDPARLITPNVDDAMVVFGSGVTVRRPNDKSARGSLMVRTIYGVGDVVTLDQGAARGWQAGAGVVFYRPPGPMAKGLQPSAEATVLGQGVVFWVEEGTAAAMITQGDRAIEVGARAIRLQ